jgi:hypothetical protein
MSVAPKSLLLAIQAPSLFEAQLRSPWGETHSVMIYLADLQIDGQLLAGVEFGGDDIGDELILGRNVLNKLALFLDGPRTQTDLPPESTLQRLRHAG